MAEQFIGVQLVSLAAIARCKEAMRQLRDNMTPEHRHMYAALGKEFGDAMEALEAEWHQSETGQSLPISAETPS